MLSSLHFLVIVVIIGIVWNINESQGKQVLTTGHPFETNKTENVHGMDKQANESISITLPGTRWCGPGNTASSYDDLGFFKETDMCCREHDFCENIGPGEEKYGLVNNDWFTRLHCDCDKTFYECLHMVNETVANVVGQQYFLIRDRCFKEYYPVIECLEYQSRVFIRRCIKYRFDTTQPKVYQWFDLPFYDTSSYPDLTAGTDKFPGLQCNKRFYEDCIC